MYRYTKTLEIWERNALQTYSDHVGPERARRLAWYLALSVRARQAQFVLRSYPLVNRTAPEIQITPVRPMMVTVPIEDRLHSLFSE